MKTIYQKITVALLAAFMIVWLPSCELDEYNPATADTETAYTSRAGFESLVNYTYDGLYYFYGKIDGVGIMEMGTDLWWAESKYAGFVQYGSELTTSEGTLKVFWQGMYSTINYCNLAIYYADFVEGYETEDDRNAKVAEAYFLRGWSYLHLVEHFGGVVLNTLPSTIESTDAPVRSTEAEIYDQIIADLQFAAEHLPINQGAEKGRASKKAAYGMLAKAYLQRTRLEETDASEYARLALAAAKEVIDNEALYECALYLSDEEVSGYAKLWDGLNNKDNTEFLFIESVDYDASSFANPDGSNRGRTRQYYLMDLKTVGADWGTAEKNCAWYGRANDRGFKPTQYLMTDLFEPVKDPADTRFEETFFTEYYNSLWKDYELSEDIVNKYGKDPSLVGHVIKNTAGTYDPSEVYYGGRTVFYEGRINASGKVNMEDEDEDGYLDGLSVYTPNYIISDEEKALLPFLCVDPSDMFEADGKWVTASSADPLASQYKECYPSMSKFSSMHWIYSNQHWMGDVPILRLGDLYLIAAEAALRYNNDQATAAQYVNIIRARAAVTSRQSEMVLPASEVTLDLILAERARELAGEQVRWVDLKRFGKLSNQYLQETNPNITGFDETKHTIRPIPQSFLDAIANASDFGTNGY